METIEKIKLTYKYLQNIYNITKDGNNRVVHSENYKGHNKKSLLKHNILTVDNGIYKWNSSKPQFSHAYDYYYKIRKANKSYSLITEILTNPKKFPTSLLLEAIAVKGLQRISSGEEIEPVIPENISSINLLESNSEPEPEMKSSDDILNKKLDEITSLIRISDQKNTVLVDIMQSLLNNISDNTSSVKSIQNSISAIIAITKNNQANLFDIAVTQYHLFKEIYLLLDVLSKDNAEYINRKNIIGEVMLHMKNRVNSNNAINNKYGGNL